MTQICPECEGSVTLAEPVRLSEISQCPDWRSPGWRR